MVIPLEKREHLDRGSDSVVFMLKDEKCIMKVYEYLARELKGDTLDDCLDVVRLYESDTLKARHVVEFEWNNVPDKVKHIILNNELYDITINILPQGKAQIRKEYNPGVIVHAEPPTPQDYVVSVGQRCVFTPNLQEILDNNYSQDILYASMREEKSSIDTVLSNVMRIVTYGIEVPFKIVPVNVKPVVDSSAKRLNLVITDLARSIIYDYAILVD